jgi:uncharacterized HAD superfamily protein
MATTPIAGIDIDGVIADPTHRLRHIEQRPKDWAAFFADAHADPPLPSGVAEVLRLQDSGLTIVYVSGRPSYLRDQTKSWLARHGLPAGKMHLRRARDYRPAPAMKLDIYRQLALEFDVRAIVDDDDRVVEVLSAAGFPVTHANWYLPGEGDQAALTEAQDEQGRT